MLKRSGLEWPRVGRDDEVRQALDALTDDEESTGVVLIGDSGVGKSTLARTLADILEARGSNVRYVLCTEQGREVPFGAFYWLSTLAPAREPAAMLAAAQMALEQEKDLVVAVDDAHLLDPLSASLVYQLAARGRARLIVTIRTGYPVLDPVIALWKERLLVPLRVEAFTWQQTEQLAHTVLGGDVASGLIDQLQERTAGNVLLLRGLLVAGQENGVLVHTDAGWQLRGTLRGDRQLYDLLEFRLQSLEPEELEAVEVLGAAETLDWEVMRGLCDADAVGRLERRGIIELIANQSHTVARLFHPVLGEAAIQRAGVVRTRQLNGVLAQHLQKQIQTAERHMGRVDVCSQIQLARFTMRSDLTPDLNLITDAAASALRMWNLGHCEELARFAHDRGGGLRAATVLAEAMVWQGRTAAADKVLADVDLEKAPIELVTAHSCLSATTTFFDGQVEQARRELVALKDRVQPDTGTAMIAAMQVVFAYLSGDFGTAIELGLALCDGDAPPVVKALAAAPTCWALASVGRESDFRRTADVSMRAGHFGSGPLQVIVGVAEVMVSTAAGDFTAAERVVERYATLPSANSLQAILNAMTGLVKLGRGALPSACSALQNSLSAMPSGSPFTWSMVVATWTAQAEGARGNAKAAAAALRRSEIAYGPQTAAFLPELELARAWERAAANDLVAAREHSLRAAETARRFGMLALEISALHTAVRFGDPSSAARVGELAKLLNTSLSDVVAAHARGVTDRDGDLLDVAAGRFADLGALAFAADAAAQAAAEHARKGHRSKEVESSVRAYGLARRCGLHTPTVAAAARPLPITSRETEIVDLVATGLSNRQIADQLVISVRTIEGHLYRIFAKLGISSRDQLIHLLDLNRLGAQGAP